MIVGVEPTTYCSIHSCSSYWAISQPTKTCRLCRFTEFCSAKYNTPHAVSPAKDTFDRFSRFRILPYTFKLLPSPNPLRFGQSNYPLALVIPCVDSVNRCHPIALPTPLASVMLSRTSYSHTPPGVKVLSLGLHGLTILLWRRYVGIPALPTLRLAIGAMPQT